MHKIEIWQTCICEGVKAKVGLKTHLSWLPQIGDNISFSPLVGSIKTASHEFLENDFVHVYELNPNWKNFPIDIFKPPVIIKINNE